VESDAQKIKDSLQSVIIVSVNRHTGNGCGPLSRIVIAKKYMDPTAGTLQTVSISSLYWPIKKRGFGSVAGILII
jgi:hypothetical protein